MTDLKPVPIPIADPRTAFLKEALLRDLKELVQHIEANGLDYDFDDASTWKNDPREQERLEEIVENYICFVAEVRPSAYITEYERRPEARASEVFMQQRETRKAWCALLNRARKHAVSVFGGRDDLWQTTFHYHESGGVSVVFEALNPKDNPSPEEFGDCSIASGHSEDFDLEELRNQRMTDWLDDINNNLII